MLFHWLCAWFLGAGATERHFRYNIQAVKRKDQMESQIRVQCCPRRRSQLNNGPTQRINQYTAQKLVKLITQTADEISRKLDCADR